MAELIFRTEDIQSDEILNLFVETRQDREIIDFIKSPSPTVLVGSRGVGKSFLLKVAEAELLHSFKGDKVLPVYVTFNKSSLIYSPDPMQFLHWMIARLCTRLLRYLRKLGFLATPPSAISVLSGGNFDSSAKSKVESILDAFENSWKNPEASIDLAGLPTVDDLRDAIEEICEDLGIRRINFLIDEAAHIFRPEQQRQFFTLFRDLRTSFISCNAAVYPGVTSFGDIFQPVHDATFKTIDRSVLADDYTSKMREIVEKQLEADSDLLSAISRHGQNFAVLAFAANGNPRILLKTVARAPRITAQQINETIREYYRTEIWSEHSLLSEKYPGHTALIDWGRKFIEQEVLPGLKQKNTQYLEADKSTTCFFWLHRDCPYPVKEALRLLAYTGIVTEHAQGIKATRSEIGTRYAVNLGCLFSLEPTPASTAFAIAKNLTPKRMTEYGMNHPIYDELINAVPEFGEADMSEVLKRELEKSINVLDLTNWQKQKLAEMNLQKIGDVLSATEDKLKEAKYVGDVRSRRMRSAAIASVYEYLSG